MSFADVRLLVLPLRRLPWGRYLVLAVLLASGLLIGRAEPARAFQLGSCGSSKWQRLLVRDTYGGANFGPACDAHDVCYGTPGKAKDECDKQFQSTMRQECKNTYASAVHVVQREACLRVADGYYSAVHRMGGDAYREAQRNAAQPPANPDPTSGLSFRNKTDATVYVALGYYQNDGWQSMGWYEVKPGAVVTVLPGRLAYRSYYFFAQSGTQRIWKGNSHFWVHPTQAFGPIATSLPAADARRLGYTSPGFREIDTGESRAFILNLTQ